MENKTSNMSKKPRRRRNINKYTTNIGSQNLKTQSLMNDIAIDDGIKTELSEQYKILVPIKKQKIREYVTSNDEEPTSSPTCSQTDYQKPVKVKSRWTQSCQMEMLMEESQSSFEMSDTVIDNSTDDFNENIECNEVFRSTEVRRSSRRSGNTRTDYRQLLGLKKNKDKKVNTPKSFNLRRGRKKKHSIDLLKKENHVKDTSTSCVRVHDDSVLQKSSVDWNIITVWGSSRSVDIELSHKSIRRNSLSWNFKFIDTNVVELPKVYNEDTNQILNKNTKILNLHKNISESATTINKIMLCKSNNLVDNHKSEINNEFNMCNILNSNIVLSKNTEEIIPHVTLDTKMYESLINSIGQQTNSLISSSNIKKLSQRKNDTITETNNFVNKNYKLDLKTHKYFTIIKDELFQSNFNPHNLRSKSVDSVLDKVKTNNFNVLKRYKSCDNFEVNHSCSKMIISLPSQVKSPTKNRRQSKRIKPKNNFIDLLDDIKVPDVNYNKVAIEISKEHEQQLLKAKCNDQEFNEALKSVNFTLINENMYRPDRQSMKSYSSTEISRLRKLKQRTISGDINVFCECTLTKEDIVKGKIGCGDQCLNRLLKIECGSSCSLKRYCSNKQFQNKQFKKTKLFKTDNKGYGICALEDIPKGVLIYEYVGEVIDYNEMCNRLKKKIYKNLNYMVQLNSDEIIDSTSKGNVTRFINHSCDPNSVGEKWHVLGQSRMGFFSTRPIMKGEEITFDYSFQVFGDGAQICYCGSSKCRGYISKASQITDISSSDDSDITDENNLPQKSDKYMKRKRMVKKRIVLNEKNNLRELGRQLTEISKLKTGFKADQEMATLNLNRLMVHISDSVSRLHILNFIREHDMNHKRLFMDFNGLSIIHNWMTSNDNKELKIMILEMLAELPIMNRNTITKSKVLDVVAEWAQIPFDAKSKIENLEYTSHESDKHCQEIENILPSYPNSNDEAVNFVEKARSLWKKWIVLKIVFKIPKKLEQQKLEIPERVLHNINDDYDHTVHSIEILERKMSKIPYKTNSKINNKIRPTTNLVYMDRIKIRKEYEQKIELERKKNFRKKVLDNWMDNKECIMKITQNGIVQRHQEPMHSPSYITPHILNNNDVRKTRWDNQPTIIVQPTNISNTIHQNIQSLNALPPETLLQSKLVSRSPYLPIHQLHSNCQLDFPLTHNPLQPSPSPLFNSSILVQPFSKKLPTSLVNIAQNDFDSEKSLVSPTKLILNSLNSNVHHFMQNSLLKNNQSSQVSSSNQIDEILKNIKAVKSGVDLLARIRVISKSFKKQPSKLLKIKNSVQSKFPQPPLNLSDVSLFSITGENKKVVFYNKEANIASNSLCSNLLQFPTKFCLNYKNKFSTAILNSLLSKTKDENKFSVPKTFIIQNMNSEVLTCNKVNKEIELHKKLKFKKYRKVVGYLKTQNSVLPVFKKKIGLRLKGIKGIHYKIPATKRNMVRKGNIHRLALKNCIIKTKSALKKHTNVNVDDPLKKTKEKRVTFLIEGESDNSTSVDVRPINLNQITSKQKPLMKCHPFEIRKEFNISSSTLQPSTSSEDTEPQISSNQINDSDSMISPIVSKLKLLRNRKMKNLRNKSNSLEQLPVKRKHKIPVSMMSFSTDVLKLIPDSRKEMKKIMDYHNSMATIIVKTLGCYAKKTCQQGRIRSDEDFKFLAKKINENILLKELQLKKADKLKISNNTKEKVADYIKKYMSRFGEVYKRKKIDYSGLQKQNNLSDK
ncbi:uncharacterized protein LOC126907706 [Daktulosphaira vitifoliae]|uniref:uncharacterized protein LOC126907706 n=1 Tax=Daktulosphaira vitifoliae TaxID=58002 RepID=UPI0021AA794B|nr:uncharacterized protein LOC126907706 [Daktulosphaira vitifoliae]